MRYAVIGGGISGLTLCYELESLAWGGSSTIDLFEAQSTVGGVISTKRWKHLILEMGPDSLVDKPRGVVDLCHRVGLGDQLISLRPTAKPPLWLKADGWHDFPSVEARSYTLRSGLDQLPKALQNSLQRTKILTNTSVQQLTQSGREWWVNSASGREGPYDAVILAIPAASMPTLVSDIDGGLLTWVDSVQYQHRAVIGSVYARKGFSGHSLWDHTGFVVSKEAGLDLSACTWLNTKWNYKEDNTDYLVSRTFWGPPGPDPSGWSDQELIDRQEAVLARLVGAHEPPLWTHVMRHQTALPSVPEHLVIPRWPMTENQPYIGIIGPYIGGPGLSDCVRVAWEEAEHLAAWVGRKTHLQGWVVGN